jgi:hypothetical protein
MEDAWEDQSPWTGPDLAPEVIFPSLDRLDLQDMDPDADRHRPMVDQPGAISIESHAIFEWLFLGRSFKIDVDEPDGSVRELGTHCTIGP